MKAILYFLPILFLSVTAYCQDYSKEIASFRTKYIADLLKEEHAPIKASDTDKISFFEIDPAYKVTAKFKATPNSTPFMIATHSSKKKEYREYGILSFSVRGTVCTLHAYQSLKLMQNEQYKDYLFVPFNDLTNYESTYGGGRYIDLSLKDVANGTVTLDFNKCYNPYCAYSEGYSCPIPPDENRLEVAITAGEKQFQNH